MSVTYVELKKKDSSHQEVAILSEEEALKRQYELLSDWEPKSDIWPLKWGRALLSTGSIISSVYIMNYYRRKLKLFSYGRPIMFFPGVFIPAVMVPVLHQHTVTDPILLGPQCPVCMQVRSALTQTTGGVFYPVLVNSVSAFFLANAFATYRLPTFSLRTRGELLSVWRRLSRPLLSLLPLHLLCQLVLSIGVTQAEAGAYFTVQRKLLTRLKEGGTSASS